MAKYVIVGGVAGGAGVAARLRRLDEKAEIVMFERGANISYANCGLPYYAGGVITDQSRLFVMTPESFREILNASAKTRHEVLSIDRQSKTVRVRDLEKNIEFDETYDTLILSPGAMPLRPPIPGIDDPSIMSLRSVTDIDTIKEKIDAPGTKRAVVVGGGFIGLEMAENLKERGLEVTVIEALEQVMNIIDYDFAAIVQQHMREQGIALKLKNGVAAFVRRGSIIEVQLADGSKVETDMVILSIGVKPDTAIARDAKLDLAQNGAIKVDEYFRTSDPAIRAVGDAIEFTSPLLGKAVTVPLAGPANKQARLCANNIVLGDTRPYSGTIATSIAKIFEMTVASTGLTEKQLKKANLPYSQAITHAGSHAGYYPDSLQFSLKILYHPDSGKLWGAQAVGFAGVDKRIDVLSAYIKKDGTIHDLTEFEQAYAPPYSSAKDPINMVGFIAENSMSHHTNLVSRSELEAILDAGAFLIDARTPEEYSLGSIPGAHNIPQIEIRTRVAEIPRGKPLIVFCAMGLRGYLAERTLIQLGFTDIRNLSGGYKSWKMASLEQEILVDPEKANVALYDTTKFQSSEDGSPRKRGNETIVPIDACGLQCPGPIMRLKQEADKLTTGDRITIKATDPGFARDVRSWCTLTGNELIALSKANGTIEAVIEKGGQRLVKKETTAENATLIVFSNDFDKTLASFVLANGAAATGKKVTMFFTFWGLSILRNRKAPRIKKDVLGRMFSTMLPRDMNALSLSGMNFAGLGPRMMKYRMKKKQVDQLEIMYGQAKEAGVRMIACQMSMDIMGISEQELLEGVEIGGVAAYMEAASESGINLFI